MSQGHQEPRKPRVARKLPRKAEKLLANGNARVAAIEARPDLYAAPNPSLAQCKANLGKLAASMEAAVGAGPVARAAVKAAAEVVTSDQNLLGAYIQSLADAATPEQGAVLIATALFDLRKVRTPGARAELVVKLGPTSGSARLQVARIAGALVYYWEVSTDGKTFSKAVDTDKVSALLTGLTPGQTYFFRFRAFVRKSGYTNYSQVVSLLVI